jgi:hypothetical protein
MPNKVDPHTVTQTYVEMKLQQQVIHFLRPYTVSLHQAPTTLELAPSLSYIVLNTIAAVVGIAVSAVLIVITPGAVLSAVALLY